jgi:hypothetical protein
MKPILEVRSRECTVKCLVRIDVDNERVRHL